MTFDVENEGSDESDKGEDGGTETYANEVEDEPDETGAYTVTTALGDDDDAMQPGTDHLVRATRSPPRPTTTRGMMDSLPTTSSTPRTTSTTKEGMTTTLRRPARPAQPRLRPRAHADGCRCRRETRSAPATGATPARVPSRR